jgi:hypothetical protein
LSCVVDAPVGVLTCTTVSVRGRLFTRSAGETVIEALKACHSEPPAAPHQSTLGKDQEGLGGRIFEVRASIDTTVGPDPVGSEPTDLQLS